MVAYHFEKVIAFLPDLLSALPLTLWVLLLTTVLGSFLGALLAWAQISKDQLLNAASRSFVFMMRCTPPIVLIFLVFYGLPKFLQWWLQININSWSRSVFSSIAMVLLFSATTAEVFKSAYLAIPKGQSEAGLSIGLTPLQSFVRIVLPQSLRVVLPNLSNAILNLLKDIALAYTIGLVDIMGASNLLIGRNMGNYSLETYTAAALIYWTLSLIITLVLQQFEKKLTPDLQTKKVS